MYRATQSILWSNKTQGKTLKRNRFNELWLLYITTFCIKSFGKPLMLFLFCRMQKKALAKYAIVNSKTKLNRSSTNYLMFGCCITWVHFDAKMAYSHACINVIDGVHTLQRNTCFLCVVCVCMLGFNRKINWCSHVYRN